MVRRRHLEPEPRRPRSAQDLRSVHGSVELAGPADRHPREDDQGLRHGRSRPGDEHHPPAEEAARRSAEEIPRSVPSADPRRRPRQRAVPQVRRRFEGTRVHARSPSGPRRLSAGASSEGRVAAGAGAVGIRAAAEGHGRRPRDLHDDGVRADPEHPAERQGARQAHRADRAGRVAYLRYGRPVPPDRYLESGRPEVRAGRFRPADVLPRIGNRSDPAGRHQRSRRYVSTGSQPRRRTRRTARS